MLKKFLRFFYSIYCRLFKGEVITPMKVMYSESVSRFIETGNIVVGINCDLSQLIINIYGSKNGSQNIIIGDNCYLSGVIVLYNPDAKVSIGERVFIGHGSTLFCYDRIEILNDVMISWGCTLIDTNAHSLKSMERLDDVINWKKGWQFKDWSNVESRAIVINSKSWIGFNSIISKGVHLGEGTVVASGSVVSKATTPFTVVGGNPATFIKQTE